MKKTAIIINGKGGVGKDTLCDFISKHYNTRKVSSITPILTIAKAGGWNGSKDDKSRYNGTRMDPSTNKKDDKSRKLLSDLKHLFTNYNDLSLAYLKSQTEEFLLTSDEILFIHMREPEEIAKYIKYATEKQLTCKTFLIKRDTMEHKIYGNDADDMVDYYHYDVIYKNNLSLSIAEEDFLTFFRNNLIGGTTYE